MTWDPGPRPKWVQDAIDSPGPLLEPALAPFDADELMAEARMSVARDDFGPGDFADPLTVLLHSADTDADLHVLGRWRLREMVLRLLTNRLKLAEYVRRDPGVLDEVIEAPLVVTGSPRSGTSILHQLLARDPAHRAPLAWEFWAPLPPPEEATYDRDPRIAISDRELRMHALLAPQMDGIHEVTATATRECVAAMSHAFVSDHFWGVFDLPSYETWLWDADPRPAYDMHRLILQVLQRKVGKRRWVLKAPSHLASLDTLFAVYPDAELVVTHRDPLEMLSSVVSLLATLHWAHSRSVDFPALVASQVDRNARLLEGFVDWRDAHGDAQVHDVDYAAFVADPAATLERLYAATGRPFTDGARIAMGAHLAAKPQGRHGGHQHSVNALGLSAADIARVARYTQRFVSP